MSGSKVLAWVAALLGLLAIAAIPIGMVVASRSSSISLLEAEEVAVAAGIVIGLLAISLARRARYRVDRSVRRRGDRFVRTARLVAWSGLYVACVGGLSLAFYGLLVLKGG
jgi:uncharacterized membrane protein YidH (DUF202 family)